MSNVMTVALQFTAIDMMRGIVDRIRTNILSLGQASGQVKRDFDAMSRDITTGLKVIAATSYAVSKIKPGVAAAGNLQEAMLGVKMNIASSAASARELTDMLARAKGSAISVSANAPFSAEDVVRIQTALLKAGMDMKDVIGDSGAAFSATVLAALSGEAPAVVGDALANIGSMFKFKNADYGAFSDWLTRVDDAAATNLPALLQGLRMSGSAADALGISANEAVTALGALSPLGERAGSSFSNFLMALARQRKALKAMNMDMFQGGKFVGLEAATDMLKERFGGIKDDGVRLGLLIKIFGEEGGRAANTFMRAEKGFREIEKSAQRSLGMTEKLSIWGEGFNASMTKLGGTAKTTLATLFDPLLAPLTTVLNLLNSITGSIGQFAASSPKIAKGVAGIADVAAAGGAAYGLYKLAKGGLKGASVLKGVGGLSGLMGLGAGIAKGKAVEAATGVTPVFVTNWADAGSNPLSPSNPDARKKLEDLFTKSTGGVSKGAGLAGKLGGLARGAGGVLAAGAAGYAVGTVFNAGIDSMMQSITGGKHDSFGSWLYDALHDKNDAEAKEVKNDIKINVRVDQDRRVLTELGSLKNTDFRVDLDRGSYGGY